MFPNIIVFALPAAPETTPVVPAETAIFIEALRAFIDAVNPWALEIPALIELPNAYSDLPTETTFVTTMGIDEASLYREPPNGTSDIAI